MLKPFCQLQFEYVYGAATFSSSIIVVDKTILSEVRNEGLRKGVCVVNAPALNCYTFEFSRNFAWFRRFERQQRQNEWR